MNYKVHLKPNGNTLTVRKEETILAAALRQNYQFPHSCRNAICGACKGRLLDGKVDYGNKPIYALSEAERESGLILCCSAKPLSDLILQIDEVISPEHIPIQTLTAKILGTHQLAPTVWQVLLQPQEAKPHYRAGQYLEILHRDESPKPFSIANAPNERGIIELHVRHTPENAYTSELMAEIVERSSLRIKLPFGDCIYPKESGVKTILLAGGTGFAPMKAILEQALTKELAQPIYCYWGARNLEDLYQHDLLLAWAQQYPWLHYVPVLSLADLSWQGKRGLVHEAVISDHPELHDFQVYASGPPEMVYAAARVFQAHGLPRAYLYSDIFDYEPQL